MNLWRTLVLGWNSTNLPRSSLICLKILDITAHISKVRLLTVKKEGKFPRDFRS